MPPAVLLQALERAGATFEDTETTKRSGPPITKADLMACGLAGPGSVARRGTLLKQLDLPEHLTANGLLEALNLLYSRETFLRRMESGEHSE